VGRGIASIPLSDLNVLASPEKGGIILIVFLFGHFCKIKPIKETFWKASSGRLTAMIAPETKLFTKMDRFEEFNEDHDHPPAEFPADEHALDERYLRLLWDYDAMRCARSIGC
jgi:hypothetical protein